MLLALARRFLWGIVPPTLPEDRLAVLASSVARLESRVRQLEAQMSEFFGVDGYNPQGLVIPKEFEE